MQRTHIARPSTLSLTSSVLLGLLAACTGSSGDDAPALTLAVTDAASEEVASFIVGVESVRLERAGGGTVGVLPDPVAVDFASLTDLSRVLNVTNIPDGVYLGAEVTLDFTNARVVLIDENGPANLFDSDGNALTGQVDLPVTFAAPLAVIKGRHHVLELDLDLDQSLVVDAPNNEVVIEPSMVVRVDRNDPKELAIGGELVSVDFESARVQVELDVAPGNPPPVVNVQVDSDTVFQIDGVSYLGAAGLTQIEGMPVGTWLQAFGTVDNNSARFGATSVEAGRGSFNGGSDIVEGHIVQRVGGAGADAQFVVLGHSNDATHVQFQYNQLFTINTDLANTKVVKRGSVDAFDTDDLNVGQAVRLFGTLNAPSGQILDATATTDVIRLQPTRLLGSAAGAPAGGTQTLNLTRVDLRLQNTFTWADSGTTPPNPAAMTATVANLGQGLGIGAGDPIAITGFFRSVDDGSTDFLATALENRALGTSLNTLMVIHDRANGMTVTPAIQELLITFSVSGVAGAGELALIDNGFAGQTALPNVPDPKLVPANQLNSGYFTIRDRTLGTVTTYLDFAEFTAGLELVLSQGAVIYNLGAVGHYTQAQNTIDARTIGVVVD